MAKWYYLVDGKETGPIEPAELKRLADSGALNPIDLVRRQDMAEWYQAKQVKGLFSNGHRNANAPPPAPKTEPHDGVNESAPPRPPLLNVSASSARSKSYRKRSDQSRLGFSKWYSHGIGELSLFVQILAWLFYGFVWIPLWWLISDVPGGRAALEKNSDGLGLNCPHCGTELRASQSSGGLGGECPYCGRNLSAPTIRGTGHLCPRCGGNDIKTFEFVHALGKTKKTASLSVGGGSLSDLMSNVASPLISIAGAKASGALGTVTGLAELCAPPERAKFDSLYAERREYNERVFPKKFEVWKRSWICVTCGSHWVAES